MQKGLAILLLLLAALPCPAQESLPTWNSEAAKTWFAQNPTPDVWPKAADALQAQLAAEHKRASPDCFSNADFQGWLEHLEWIRLGLDCSDLLADAGELKTFLALGQDDSVSHLFVEKLDPRDDKKQALKILLKLADAKPDDLHEYAALGVAYSLVWDQPFPKDWPHAQVSRDAVPIGDLDIVQRFNFYVRSNRDKKLDLDISRLSFENLKYLVNSKVKLSEFEYAQQNRISLSHFADAFFAINYDNNRIGNAAAVYDWPYPTYTLADIEKSGGICIDQAYYAETLGKGRGIPTIRFTGFGMDGAHAWFGYLSESGKWELDCGRYAEQNFPKGYAVDPQTWRRIDDSVLDNLFKNGAINSNYQHAMNALAWARLNQKDAAAYPKILDEARAIMPEWSGTWRLQADLVEKSGDLDQTKAFYQAWVTQFGGYPELKVEGQMRLYRDLRQANDDGAEDLLKEVILQNRSEGFDLGIQAGAEVLRDKLNASDWDGARLEYERSIRDFGEEGGLTLFIQIVEPYIEACLENGKIDQADSAISFTEDRMSINEQSQVGLRFVALKNEVKAKKLAQP